MPLTCKESVIRELEEMSRLGIRVMTVDMVLDALKNSVRFNAEIDAMRRSGAKVGEVADSLCDSMDIILSRDG